MSGYTSNCAAWPVERLVNHKSGGDVHAHAVGREGGAHDGARVDGQRAADAGDVEDVIVAVAHHVEFARRGQRAGDAVIVIHGESLAVELAAKQLAVEAQVVVMPCVGGDAVEVAIVIAEDDVDGLREPAA